jgi:hypothetical protein
MIIDALDGGRAAVAGSSSRSGTPILVKLVEHGLPASMGAVPDPAPSPTERTELVEFSGHPGGSWWL